MATIITSPFTRYALTDKEKISGQTLTQEQQHVIQNLIADAAEEKIALTYDPLNPISFAQAEAELQGKIGILQYILSNSQEVTTQNMQLNLDS